MNKQLLRQAFLQKRRAMNPSCLQQWSWQIEEHVMTYVRDHQIKTVMAYAAFRHEVETKTLINRLLAAGVRVGLPKCSQNGIMIVYTITDYNSLRPGRFGILEPPEENLMLPEDIELVLVPGCAFGRDMSRLGYGGGYYDRYLPQCTGATYAGIAYEFSVTDRLPTDTFDVLMDVLITEKGVVNKV